MGSQLRAAAHASGVQVAIMVIPRKQSQALVLFPAFWQHIAATVVSGADQQNARNLFADLWDAPRLKRWPARFGIRRGLDRAQETELQRELAEIEAEFRPTS